jgi:hypothetical protein
VVFLGFAPAGDGSLSARASTVAFTGQDVQYRVGYTPRERSIWNCSWRPTS